MTETSPEREKVLGTAAGFASYLLWGFLPLYFVILAPTGPWEVVAWRIILSLAFCAILLTITRGWSRMVRVLRTLRLALLTALAGVLVYVNWQVFLVAAQTGRVLEASLGYFINPIMTVLLAVVFLRERIRALQWAAIGIAAVAVIVIIVAYGSVPWLSIILTCSFGAYGLVKNRIGHAVDAVSGLALETLWLTPVATVILIVVGVAGGGITFGTVGGWHTLALALAGVVTAVPLLLFASATRRVSLSTIGLLQFAAPILQFVCGAFILGEPMPPERWIGFGIVWVAAIVLAADVVLHSRRPAAVVESA
ncbi:MAG: EamA family transporter RarD [Microbacterium sp.]